MNKSNFSGRPTWTVCSWSQELVKRIIKYVIPHRPNEESGKEPTWQIVSRLSWGRIGWIQIWYGNSVICWQQKEGGLCWQTWLKKPNSLNVRYSLLANFHPFPNKSFLYEQKLWLLWWKGNTTKCAVKQAAFITNTRSSLNTICNNVCIWKVYLHFISSMYPILWGARWCSC